LSAPAPAIGTASVGAVLLPATPIRAYGAAACARWRLDVHLPGRRIEVGAAGAGTRSGGRAQATPGGRGRIAPCAPMSLSTRVPRAGMRCPC